MRFLRFRAGGSARVGSLALLDQAVVSGTSFLTTVIVGRVKGPDELAVYALGMTLIVFIAGVQESLVSLPYTIYAIRLRRSARAACLTSAFALQLVLALLFSATLLATGLLWIDLDPPPLRAMLVCLAAVVPFALLREFARRSAIAHLDLGVAFSVDALAAGLQLLGLMGLAATGTLTARTALGSLAVACAAAGLYWLRVSRTSLRVRARRFRPTWRRHWLLGRWILAGRIMSHLNSDVLLSWLVLAVAGPTAAGAFAGCLTIVFLSNPFVLGIGLFLTPKMAHTIAQGGVGSMRHIVWQVTLGVAAVFAVFVSVLYLLGASTMHLLYGNQLLGYEQSLVILGFAIAASALSLGPTAGLLALERPDLSLLSSTCGFIIMLLCAPSWIGRWGVFGAGLTLLAGNLTQTAARLTLFWRLTATMGKMPFVSQKEVPL